LGSGAEDAIRLAGEAGWLYLRVEEYILEQQRQKSPEEASDAEGGGSLARALARALSEELQSYRTTLARMEDSVTNETSLREILAAVQGPLRRLKTLAVVTDGVANLQGAQILTALHRHADRHGDAQHAAAVQGLLQAACRPWFDMLYAWTVEGQLIDPAHEFFVASSSSVAQQDRSDKSNLWRAGYLLQRDKVPTGILDADMVEQVFVLGKGVNFIRECLCEGGEWSVAAALDGAESTDETSPVDPPSDSRGGRKKELGFYYPLPSSHECNQQTHDKLRSTLRQAAALTHSHILQSLRNQYCLMQHLFALKQFLLLGQGDFYSSLMDALYTEFFEHNRGSIVGIYRHTLAAIVESCIRSTNASSFSQDILDRLQVELLLDKDDDVRYMFGSPKTKVGVEDQRTVWDIFTLDYVVPDPVRAIVNSSSMESYKRMFSFLFGVKKIEFGLNLTWRQSAVLQHALHTAAQYNGIKVGSNPAYAQAVVLLRQIAMTRQSMMHFVGNLKIYLMFEVIEGGWKDLVPTVNEAETLDEVIGAHDSYLTSLCRKSLLPTKEVEDAATTEDSLDLGGKVDNLLLLVAEFCSYQEDLFGDALEAAERATEKRREAENRLKHGEWGFQSEKEVAEEESFFGLADAAKLTDLDRLSAQFDAQIVDLLEALDAKLNVSPSPPILEDRPPLTPTVASQDRFEPADDEGDLESLRFLSFQLDHNSYYGLVHF
jgi:gamma-tubulin complex component 3